MSSSYVWINNNEMYMWTKNQPEEDWCDSFIEIENVDLDRYFVVEYDGTNASLIYKEKPEEESKIPFLL